MTAEVVETSFDQKTHSYLINGKPATGVTTIISVLAKPALISWAARMACEYVAGHKFDTYTAKTVLLDGGTVLSTVSEEEKLIKLADLAPVLDEAKNAHTRKKEAAGTHGTDAHALVETLINMWLVNFDGKVPETFIDTTSHYKTIEPFIKWAQENVDHFTFSERRMFNKDMFIAGTADFAYVDKKGRRMVGDYKTSGGIWGIDYFLQVAAYKMLAEAEGDEPYDGMTIVRHGKKGPKDFEVQYLFDYETYKNAFLACLTLYRAQAALKDVVLKEV